VQFFGDLIYNEVKSIVKDNLYNAKLLCFKQRFAVPLRVQSKRVFCASMLRRIPTPFCLSFAKITDRKKILNLSIT